MANAKTKLDEFSVEVTQEELDEAVARIKAVLEPYQAPTASAILGIALAEVLPRMPPAFAATMMKSIEEMAMEAVCQPGELSAPPPHAPAAAADLWTQMLSLECGLCKGVVTMVEAIRSKEESIVIGAWCKKHEPSKPAHVRGRLYHINRQRANA